MAILFPLPFIKFSGIINSSGQKEIYNKNNKKKKKFISVGFEDHSTIEQDGQKAMTQLFNRISLKCKRPKKKKKRISTFQFNFGVPTSKNYQILKISASALD